MVQFPLSIHPFQSYQLLNWFRNNSASRALDWNNLLYKTIKEENPDGLPFYERKITNFKDKRVEAFSLIIDMAKELFADYNERVNDFILAKVKEYASNNLWQDVAEEINAAEIVVWEKIILSALKLAENPNNISFDEWKKYIDNHKRNLSITLDQIIASTQLPKNLEVPDNSIKIRRFKPL